MRRRPKIQEQQRRENPNYTQRERERASERPNTRARKSENLARHPPPPHIQHPTHGGDTHCLLSICSRVSALCDFWVNRIKFRIRSICWPGLAFGSHIRRSRRRWLSECVGVKSIMEGYLKPYILICYIYITEAMYIYIYISRSLYVCMEEKPRG